MQRIFVLRHENHFFVLFSLFEEFSPFVAPICRKNFEDYFEDDEMFEDYLRCFPDETVESIIHRYEDVFEVYLGTAMHSDLACLKRVQDEKLCRAATRIFVDALINPILRRNNKKVRPQTTIDYIISIDSEEVMGVIDTRAGGCVIAESVGQCMKTLENLHAKAPCRLFGIVTDGVGYVFIILTIDGKFELKLDSRGEIVVTGIDTWDKACEVAGFFNFLLEGNER